jgi:hypothetical protein
MQANWLEILGQLFEVIIFPILSIAVGYLITWLKAKKQEVLEKTKNETVKKYVELLDKTITDCVLATNQTYVGALKEAGRFDAEAQKEAFKQTFDAVMNILSDDAQIYLKEAIKDLGAYITTRIEAEIIASKE